MDDKNAAEPFPSYVIFNSSFIMSVQKATLLGNLTFLTILLPLTYSVDGFLVIQYSVIILAIFNLI